MIIADFLSSLQHCNLDFGSYTKDLSAISSDLSSIFILDNSPGAYRSYPGELTSCLRHYGKMC